jgi:hypothetical protein
MRAFAAASSRSACATSGRRSSNSDGNPGGTSGAGTFHSFVESAARRKLLGNTPSKTAKPFSNSDRRRASAAASDSAAASSVSARATSNSVPTPPSKRLRTSWSCSLRKPIVRVIVSISASSARSEKYACATSPCKVSNTFW